MISFNNSSYNELPYLNANENTAITLNTLFNYQKLTIPSSNVSDEFYILNIKKQFICISYNDLSSGIYVKKSIINDTDLSLIKTLDQKNAFDTILNKTVKINNGGVTDDGKELFDKVYVKINNSTKPYFASGTNSTFQGGNKRGGTRKVGGSRSR